VTLKFTLILYTSHDPSIPLATLRVG